MSRVGVGVIGAGVISDQYLANLTTFPDVEVLFVADLDVERARTQAERFGVPGAGTTAELLADDRIEIVVNLTIPKVHVAVALQILAAGKHVWSEKPFALDREGGRELLAAAHAAGLRVATAPDTVLGAGIQTTRRLIESGAIGTVQSALTVFQVPGPDRWHPNPDFLFQEGAGPLFDMGPYYFTALVQLFGPVTRVTAQSAQAHTRRTVLSGPRTGDEFDVTVPTYSSVALEFASGAISHSVLSFDSAIERIQFEVNGSAGAVAAPDPNMFDGDIRLFTTDPENPETVPATGTSAGRGIGVVDLARSIRAGIPERASGELAFHVLDILVAAAESASSGQAISLESTITPSPALPEDWDPTEATLA